MTAFRFTPGPGETEIQLVGPAGKLPVDAWAVVAPPPLRAGADLAQRLLAEGRAISDNDTTLMVENEAIAALSPGEATALSLPPLTDAIAVLRSTGQITRPDFKVQLDWQRPTGQPIVGVQRVGAWLHIGAEWRRLPDVLFAIAEAVAGLAAVPADDQAGRYRALAALQEVLPQTAGRATASGVIGTMAIVVADAFSLDLEGDGEEARLVPVLHRAGAAGDAPLLPEAEQAAFGQEQFNRYTNVRGVYSVGQTFVVLSPLLRRGLSEVRQLQSAPLATKRALLASPRAFLQQALGAEAETTVIEALFRETESYSERVIGLGLWQKRVVPWVALPPSVWLERDPPPAAAETPPAAAPARGIVVGDQEVPLDAAQAAALHADVAAAMASGAAAVPLPVGGTTISVPATAEVLQLLIRANEDTVDLAAAFAPRPAPAPALPAGLLSTLKPHQQEGLAWLQAAYAQGNPGVLLADDMGLGKTLQALAFLAWLRQGMAQGVVARAPVLIVAPVGLLANWQAEHDRHLAAPGLGPCLPAYGARLRLIRDVTKDGRPALDRRVLGEADWVLTSYHTLRDYDADFGQVRFAAMLLDEAQTVKTPGVRLSDSAKAMKADFRVAITGTPVENRLGELWNIVDTVHPAYLGDLRGFSQRYEPTPDEATLRDLKTRLERPLGGRPALLRRRLRSAHLPDLPRQIDWPKEAPMPPPQRARYEQAVAAARQGPSRPGEMLKVLELLRAISLHPGEDGAARDEDFIAASARMQLAFSVLDEVARRGERALIFLRDRAMQGRLAGIVQRRYRLAAPPMIISGDVGGPARQARVNRFQVAPDGFDAMILSPQAGGVGLTLTRANHVIHLTRWWNPAVEDQCTGRALRIGQTRDVHVHVPLAVLPGDRRSFDQNLDALLARKRRLMHDTLAPPAGTDDDADALFRASVA